MSWPVPGDPCPKRRRQPWRRHPLPGQAPARRPPRTVAGGQGHSGGPHETHRRPDHLWSGQRRADVRHRLPAATRLYRQRAELRFSRALQDGAGERRRPAAGRGRKRFRRGATLREMWITTGMPCGSIRHCGCLGMATTDEWDRLPEIRPLRPRSAQSSGSIRSAEASLAVVRRRDSLAPTIVTTLERLSCLMEAHP